VDTNFPGLKKNCIFVDIKIYQSPAISQYIHKYMVTNIFWILNFVVKCDHNAKKIGIPCRAPKTGEVGDFFHWNLHIPTKGEVL